MPCSCADVGGAAERQFNERRATKDLAGYRTSGPGSTTRLLLAGLATAGPLHGRLLDIGSGVGVLSFELLDRGLTSAVGVDLSSAHVTIAAQEAARRGRAESTRFVQSDFLDVAGQLPPAEIVTLDRVVCCYPEYERLLEESLRHAGRVFAFSYPLDRWYVRTWVGLQNVGRRIVRNAFRSFVHPVPAMEHVITREGFTLVSRESTRIWRADVLRKAVTIGNQRKGPCEQLNPDRIVAARRRPRNGERSTASSIGAAAGTDNQGCDADGKDPPVTRAGLAHGRRRVTVASEDWSCVIELIVSCSTFLSSARETPVTSTSASDAAAGAFATGSEEPFKRSRANANSRARRSPRSSSAGSCLRYLARPIASSCRTTKEPRDACCDSQRHPRQPPGARRGPRRYPGAEI